MVVDADAIISAISGSALVAVLAKSFVSRSMRDLDEAVQTIVGIKTELAKISVKLDAFEKSHELLAQIDRRVVALESRGRAKKLLNGGSYDEDGI